MNDYKYVCPHGHERLASWSNTNCTCKCVFCRDHCAGRLHFVKNSDLIDQDARLGAQIREAVALGGVTLGDHFAEVRIRSAHDKIGAIVRVSGDPFEALGIALDEAVGKNG